MSLEETSKKTIVMTKLSLVVITCMVGLSITNNYR
jgi:hypothetical protein